MSAVRELIIIKGVRAVLASSRILRAKPNPSILGISMSVKIASGVNCNKICIASNPSFASVTSKPSRSSKRPNTLRMVNESSTTNMLYLVSAAITLVVLTLKLSIDKFSTVASWTGFMINMILPSAATVAPTMPGTRANCEPIGFITTS